MRATAFAFVVALLLASCGGDEPPSPVVGGPPLSGPATTRPALPPGIERVDKTDPAVVGVRVSFEQQLRDTSPTSSVSEVLVAYRGPESVFASLCPGTASSAKVILVVYMKGVFTNPSGQAKNTALYSQLEANVSGVVYANDPPLDPSAWCRPETVLGG